ncbi:MAG: AIR synthase related protein [Planctomycetota bacterium]
MLHPLPESKRALALGCAANPRYGLLDPEAMAETVIDEAIRNVVATYGDPARTALLDNFSWGNCDKPENLGALVKASRGCYRAAKAFGTPFVSGKDSLNNEYRVGDQTLSIPPTLYVTSLSVVPSVSGVVRMDGQKEGNLILLVGLTRPELGGSELHEWLGLWGGKVPRPDLRYAEATFERLHGAMETQAGHRLPRSVGRRTGGGARGDVHGGRFGLRDRSFRDRPRRVPRRLRSHHHAALFGKPLALPDRSRGGQSSTCRANSRASPPRRSDVSCRAPRGFRSKTTWAAPTARSPGRTGSLHHPHA